MTLALARPYHGGNVGWGVSVRMGLPELLIIIFILLLLFGTGRLPGLGRTLGRGVRALRQGMEVSKKKPRKTARRRDDDSDSAS